MTYRSKILSASFVALLSVLGIVYTFLAKNEPLLGVDLQGGVSVVLKPTEEADQGQMEQTVEILRARIDAIGVAEPEISLQDQTVVVSLPGAVSDQKETLDRLSQTAELRFRPVLANLGFQDQPLSLSQPELTLDQPIELSGDEDPAEDFSSETVDVEETDPSEEQELSSSASAVAPVAYQQPTTTSGSVEEDEGNSSSETTATATDPEGEEVVEGEAISQFTEEELQELLAQTALPAGCQDGATSADQDIEDQAVVLPSANPDGTRSYYCLGPTVFTGDALETASANFATTHGGGSGWSVSPVYKEGTAGIDLFNAVARRCFAGEQGFCPTTQLAAVLDHEVISAPTTGQPFFQRDQIQITGTFTEEEAKRTAEALRFGALPVELVSEDVKTISAASGDKILQSGLIAGAIGLGLVALYLLFYYRLAGFVAIFGLVFSAMLLWTIIAWIGETQGLALSLSGIVGLIVAIGVSTDSNIVYFENVKDAFRQSGSKLTTSVERAYKTSISTIIKADVVSLIAAGLLYFLTVGPVKGFALYLGLATLLDLFISMLFMRPALSLLAKRFRKNPRLLGMPVRSSS